MSTFEPDPDLDYRAHPEAYRYSPDERGVFKVHPYKRELLPLWTFKNMEVASASIEALRERFGHYREARDFVGMDMTRKYLQMGFTRAMRHAKYPGGRKYEPDGSARTAQTWADPEKRRVAVAYREALRDVREDAHYQAALQAHKEARRTSQNK